MPNGVTQQISRVPTNALNDVNDAYPGGQQSISGANIYAAQLGARMWLDGNPGGVRYDTGVGTLYGGAFQYVQFYTSASQAPAVGLPTAWAYDQVTTTANKYGAFSSYIVTTDMSALRTGRFAGVCLNAVTKGQYGWIQTKGLVVCLFGVTVSATPADGDLVYVNSAANNFAEINDGTSITAGILKAAIGVAIGAPVASASSAVLLKCVADVV